MRHEKAPFDNGARDAAAFEAEAVAALESDDPSAFLAAWLDMLAADLGGAETIAVFVEDESGTSYLPAAVWPEDTHDARSVEPVARQVISARAAAETVDDGGHVLLGAPVLLEDHMAAFVALRFPESVSIVTPAQRRRLVWALGWLEARFWHQRATEEAERYANGFRAMDLLAVAGAERRATSAAQALVNALRGEDGVSRAALGLVRGLPRKGARIRVEALSNTAWFRRRGKTVKALENAMEEALDQMAPVGLPRAEEAGSAVTVAHAAYLEESGSAAIASAVLFDEGRPIGVLTVEADAPEDLDTAARQRLEAVAALLGPVMELKRRQQSWIAGRGADAVADGLKALFGPNRPSYRLATVAAVVLLALPFVIQRPLQVKADATLEGAQQLAMTAPFQGLVARAEAKAGDRVAQGDVIFALDDRDLRLEAEKWRSELAQLSQEERRALSEGDRGEAVLLAAQKRQAEAQLALAETRLERATVRAPMDAVVISGDMSQRIGAPAEEGEQLFALAPLDAYRVVLDVDERDLDLVEPGSEGRLRLTARTGEALDVQVTSVTSVARLEEGRRLFRAHATLDGDAAGLRPGMEGIARIDAGERMLAAIWTRRLRDWVQLALWRWMP